MLNPKRTPVKGTFDLSLGAVSALSHSPPPNQPRPPLVCFWLTQILLATARVTAFCHNRMGGRSLHEHMSGQLRHPRQETQFCRMCDLGAYIRATMLVPYTASLVYAVPIRCWW